LAPHNSATLQQKNSSPEIIRISGLLAFGGRGLEDSG